MRIGMSASTYLPSRLDLLSLNYRAIYIEEMVFMES